MKLRQGQFLSPLVLFVSALALFELLVRLPYIIWVRNSPELGYRSGLHFFSNFDEDAVIFTGLTLLLVTCLACYAPISRFGASYRSDQIRLPDLRLPWVVYPISLIFIGSAFLSVSLLGIGNVLENLSGKRSEIGEDGLLYLTVKLSNFCHIIAVMFYIRIQQRGALVDRAFFVLATIALVLPTIVFSQRAILIGFALELLYIQLLFRTFNLRGLLRIIAIVIPILLLISFLRPGNSVGDVGLVAAFQTALEKVVTSRYFFDIAKLGTVTLWSFETPWLGPISLTFLVEPFAPDSVYFYKEIGPILADEAYGYRIKNGVTPGGLLEGILSFGMIGGILFFAAIFAIFLKLERLMLVGRKRLSGYLFFLKLLIISKFSLFVNSSLGAYAFQITLEAAFLTAVFVAFAVWNGVFGSVARPRTRSYKLAT